jgi:hypothetical protein
MYTKKIHVTSKEKICKAITILISGHKTRVRSTNSFLYFPLWIFSPSVRTITAQSSLPDIGTIPLPLQPLIVLPLPGCCVQSLIFTVGIRSTQMQHIHGWEPGSCSKLSATHLLHLYLTLPFADGYGSNSLLSLVAVWTQRQNSYPKPYFSELTQHNFPTGNRNLLRFEKLGVFHSSQKRTCIK